MLKDHIPKHLTAAGDGGYLVGGALRDLLSGRQPIDFDIVVQDNPASKAAQLALTTQGHYFKLGRDPYPLYRVVHPTGTIDIAAIKGCTIETDLRQRDLTINAMAFDMNSHTLIDPMEGVADLNAGLVRMTTPDSFSQDPARLIRAHRMAASLNFSIDPQTSRRIAEQADLIDGIAGERIWPELQAILIAPNSVIQIDAMRTNGLLSALFPQTQLCGHNLNALSNLEKIVVEPEAHLPGEAVNFCKTMAEKECILSKMALLLYGMNPIDPYMPDRVSSIDQSTNPKNPKSNIPDICRRLRTSTRDRNWITFVAGHHPYPMTLYRHPKKISPGHFFKLCGHYAPYILILNLAELLTHENNQNKEYTVIKDSFINLLKYYFIKIQGLISQPSLINGRELMDAMGLEPSPLIGELVMLIEEARLEGKIESKAQALAMAMRLINSRQ